MNPDNRENINQEESMSSHDTIKPVILAFCANFLIAASKLAAAVITASGSMMAESVHSFADCGNQLLLLIGIRSAKRAPSDSHPLGYGMSIYFWSFIVAIILFSLGGLFSVYEGIEKISHPKQVEHPSVALAILGISIVLETVSLAGCLAQVNRVRGKKSLLTWFRESRQSELLVVFGEDTAALAGLTVAVGSITATAVTGNTVYDAAGSIVIGVILAAVALSVGLQTKRLLEGQSADEATVAEIRKVLSSRKEIKRILNIITVQLGPTVLVAVKADMNKTGSEAGMIRAINRCEKALKKAVPCVQWSFFEPDIR